MYSVGYVKELLRVVYNTTEIWTALQHVYTMLETMRETSQLNNNSSLDPEGSDSSFGQTQSVHHRLRRRFAGVSGLILGEKNFR